MRFDETPRTIIDGRTIGFCKLIADPRNRQDSGQPCRGGARGRDRPGRGDRHRCGHAGRRNCQDSTLLPHPYRDCRANSIPCRLSNLSGVQRAACNESTKERMRHLGCGGSNTLLEPTGWAVPENKLTMGPTAPNNWGQHGLSLARRLDQSHSQND